jgi:hypothetical protein
MRPGEVSGALRQAGERINLKLDNCIGDTLDWISDILDWTSEVIQLDIKRLDSFRKQWGTKISVKKNSISVKKKFRKKKGTQLLPRATI